LVTGAASGMGRAVAERFLVEGWSVLAVDRDTTDLDKTAAELGTAFRPVPVDITDLREHHLSSGTRARRGGRVRAG
jgi:NADP-dependent 3-hydroxy acid dehydrogenase YdfG